jgi:hypothetical protein
MAASPIHDAKYLLSTELQIGQLRVLLQDSDIRRTETVLAEPLPEQIEWYRWRGRAALGHHCGWNVAVVWEISRMAGLPTRGIMPEKFSEDEAIQGMRSR